MTLTLYRSISLNIYTIYIITNLINNKKYVGQTKNYRKRFREHKGTYNDCPISKAIKKYGVNNFSFEVIYQTLDVDHVDFLECYFIKHHNSFVDDGHGYNLTRGGGTNKVVSGETRRKISEAGVGRIISEETKQKMANAKIGKIFTEEHKLNISIATRGIKRIVRTEEHKNNLSNSNYLKGKQHTIICPHCNKEGGQIIMGRWHFDNCKLQLPVEDHHDI